MEKPRALGDYIRSKSPQPKERKNETPDDLASPGQQLCNNSFSITLNLSDFSNFYNDVIEKSTEKFAWVSHNYVTLPVLHSILQKQLRRKLIKNDTSLSALACS